ncbi:MAG TPA: hypothetical protein VFQ39_02685 [Longimicrobium sp.]|nr:hypothetical protein [Longimicrobium sp.]
MGLRPCPTCHARVSDLAPRCPACGAALVPAADPAPRYAQAPWPPPPHGEAPWPPPPPPRAPGASMRTGMKIVLAFAIIFAVLNGLAGAEGESRAEMVGQVVGGALAPFLLAALFLAWSRKTRPWIPAAALAVTFFAFLGNAGDIGREGVNAELSRTRSLMSSLADSGNAGGVPGDAAAPPGGSQEAKLVWAMNRALAELPAYKTQVASRHGVDPDRLPAAWGTSRYMADASRHPEVERYWEGYRSYLADFRGSFRGWLETRIAEHARTAGVRARNMRAFTEGMGRGAELAGTETLILADSTAAAALDYHRFLVSVDDRIEYDPGQDMAMFERDADLDRANALQRRVQLHSEALGRAQDAAMRRSLEQVDQLEAQLD